MNSLQLGDDVALALAFQNALHEDVIPSLGTYPHHLLCTHGHTRAHIYVNNK